MAEPDIWFCRNGEIYKDVGVYVDNLVLATKDPQQFVEVLKKKHGFKLKGTGMLEHYLGADSKRDDDGSLAMSPKKYIKRMMFNYKKMLGVLPSMNVQSPLEPGDHPELDKSELLDGEGIEKNQYLIGSQQWAISLGRFDIVCAVQTMSSFRAAPCIGHLQKLKRIHRYLQKYKEAKIRFRTPMPDFSDIQ